MKPSTKKLLRIGAREILLTFADAIIAPMSLNPNVYPLRPYKKMSRLYLKWRNIDRQHTARRIYYLKTRGWIVDTVRGKERYLELTARGRDRLLKLLPTRELVTPKTWDKKWRIVIFDVPEKRHTIRDRLREQLLGWGFLPLQESIYVHPFECKQALNQLLSIMDIQRHVKYLIADIIEGEEEILNIFVDRGVLTRKHLQHS